MLRALFISLSENRTLRSFAEKSKMGRRLSRRFVAGESVGEALDATHQLNELGMSVTIDNLGENVHRAEEARASAALYRELIDQITTRKLDANASLKLTHMGLDVDPDLAFEITRELVRQAAAVGNFVRIDMEGSPYTERTLEMVRRLHAEEGLSNSTGAVIQSYLRRSEADVIRLCEEGIRIRLCKGAYKEPAEIAFQKKSEVDESFVRLMKILLSSGIYHGIATHDEAMIEATISYARSEGIPPHRFEFQMLYGIRRDLQETLVAEGWRMRVYLPFGSEWYPYFMRRLAERPANLLFLLKNLFRR
jgi:proline dehydrogenase